MKLLKMIRLAPLLFVGLSAFCFADNNDPLNAKKGDSNFYSPHGTTNPNVEDYVWEEQNTEIPPFPEDESLIEFQVTRPNVAFSYFIDANSLSYTKEDGIVRYTIVVKSKTGAKNVAFEGMRCSTKEFKTYAYGNGKGQLVKPRKFGWKPISANGYTRYRKDLSEFYFCNIHVLDLTVEKIIAELKYGKAGGREMGLR